MQTSLSVGLSLKILKADCTDHADQSVSRSVFENPKGNLYRPYRPVCRSVCPENPKGNLYRPYRPVCRSVCPENPKGKSKIEKSTSDFARRIGAISPIDRRSIDRSDRSTRIDLNYLLRASKSKSKIGSRRSDASIRRVDPISSIFRSVWLPGPTLGGTRLREAR
jgi:hypothetical protein